jgi:hypothetical protein
MSGGKTSIEELIELSGSAETAEDLAYIEGQLVAIESAARDTSRQKATMEILTQQAAAWLVGVSTKHLRDQGVARNVDSSYNGPDLVQWIVDQGVSKAKKEWERSSDTLKTSAERQAEAKAIKYEAQAKEVQEQYIDRDEVMQEFMEMASAVRSELKALPKAMANDFPADLRESLIKELNNQINQVLRRLASRGGSHAGR